MATNASPSKAHRSPRSTNVGFYFMLATLCVTLVACGQQKSDENGSGGIRPERPSLQEQIDALQDKLALREGELRAARKRLDDPLPPAEGAASPRLAGIVLGRYSGPVDVDGDAKYDGLRAYVRPVDGRSRPIAAEGTARLRLVVARAQGGPATILDQTYGPDAFRAAYHAGVAGPHYTLKAGLPADPPAEATLRVTLIDATTGKAFKAEKQVTLVRAKSAQ